MVKIISPQETLKLLQAGAIHLIDVRDIVEYEVNRIEGATLIPLSELSADKLPQDGLPIVFHCRSGMRSQVACQRVLDDNEDLDVSSMEGGIIAFEKMIKSANTSDNSNNKKNSCAMLPIEQQTFIMIGVLIIVSSLAGFFLNPNWLMVSLFIGSGMVFAGLTGSCKLSMLIQKMPWNR